MTKSKNANKVKEIMKKRSGKRKYKKFSEQDLKTAIGKVQAGELSLRKASKQYNISLGTLSHKIRNKHNRSVGRPQYLTSEAETKLAKVLQILSVWKFPFRKSSVSKLVQYTLNSMGAFSKFKENKPTNYWVDLFVLRNEHLLSASVTKMIKPGRAGISNPDVNDYFNNMDHSLSGVLPHNIYNYD